MDVLNRELPEILPGPGILTICYQDVLTSGYRSDRSGHMKYYQA